MTEFVEVKLPKGGVIHMASPRLANQAQAVYFRMDVTEVNLGDFAGVGKDLWQDTDVDRYLDEERDSWEKPSSE
ncbi:MAG: hypothetical protein KBG20_19920 [Caldilineaceae bacterium]|nr:hypothetical protein [Caldilineaceae bacterium]MBP8125495.1 hypothetical protein [Caldilineaceae bacterium]MBP9074587.1 hypothetical protein [Caldilineaceae bacterium]